MNNQSPPGQASDEPMPCPFCGSSASAARYGNRDGGAAYSVICDKCCVSTAWHHGDSSASRAVATWNKRAALRATADVERDAERLDMIYHITCIEPFIGPIATKAEWLASIDRAVQNRATKGAKP